MTIAKLGIIQDVSVLHVMGFEKDDYSSNVMISKPRAMDVNTPHIYTFS